MIGELSVVDAIHEHQARSAMATGERIDDRS